MAKPRVFVTRRLPGEAVHRLAQLADVDLWPEELPPPYDVLRARASEADGLLCLLTDRVDGALIEAAPRLRVISQMAVGYDNIAIGAATARGIPVGNTPGVLTEATADLTFALILAVARRIVEAEQFVREGRWRTWDPGGLLGLELSGATLGIVGLGKIGRAVARRAQGFGLRVVYASRSPVETELASPVTLDELLGEADIVSLHVPLTAETERMIGERELRRMKNDAILINTARGGIVDQRALVRALGGGWIGGAGLDVAAVEPIPADDALLRAPNCVLLPHIGSATFKTRTRMAAMAVDNLIAGLEDRPLPHCVNPDVYRSNVNRQ
jgi:glyoxylate reductase